MCQHFDIVTEANQSGAVPYFRNSFDSEKILEGKFSSNFAGFLGLVSIKPIFHHDNDQFWAKTKRLVGRMTAQRHNRFVFRVVVVQFAVNGNQTLQKN